MWLNSLYKEFEMHSEQQFEFEKVYNKLKDQNTSKSKRLKQLKGELIEERQTFSFLHQDDSYHLETRMLELESQIKETQEELQIHQLYSDQREHIIKRHEKQISRIQNEKYEIEFLIEKVNKLQDRVLNDLSRVKMETNSYRNKYLIEQKQNSKMNNSLQYQIKYKSNQARLESDKLVKEKSIFLTLEEEISDKKQLKLKLSQIADSIILNNNNESILQQQQELDYQNQLHYINQMFLDGQNNENEFIILEKMETKLQELQQLNETYEKQIFNRFEDKDKYQQQILQLDQTINQQQQLLLVTQYCEYKQQDLDSNITNIDHNNKQVYEDIRQKDQLSINLYQFIKTYKQRLLDQLKSIHNDVNNHKLQQLVSQESNQETLQSNIDYDIIIETLIYNIDKYCEQQLQSESIQFSNLLETWNILFNRPIIQIQFNVQSELNSFLSKLEQNIILVINTFHKNLLGNDNKLISIIIDDITSNELLNQFILLDINQQFLIRIQKIILSVQQILLLVRQMCQDILKGSINGKYELNNNKQSFKKVEQQEQDQNDKYATFNVIDDSDFNKLNSRFKIQPKLPQLNNNDTLLQEFKYFLSSRSCAKSQSPSSKEKQENLQNKTINIQNKHKQDFKIIINHQKTYDSIKSLNRSYEADTKQQQKYPKVFKIDKANQRRSVSPKLPQIKTIKYK